jgi:hypothetical protein
MDHREGLWGCFCYRQNNGTKPARKNVGASCFNSTLIAIIKRSPSNFHIPVLVHTAQFDSSLSRRGALQVRGGVTKVSQFSRGFGLHSQIPHACSSNRVRLGYGLNKCGGQSRCTTGAAAASPLPDGGSATSGRACETDGCGVLWSGTGRLNPATSSRLASSCSA